MIRLKTGLKVILLSSLSLWMVGCQQTSPLGMAQRYSNPFPTQQQTHPTTDYSNHFNNLNKPQTPQNQTPTQAQPAPAETSCSRYTAPAQNVITACEPVIAQYADDLADIAPNCFPAFQAITPNTGCSVLIPQLNSVLNACGIVFSNYSSYLTQSCNMAVQTLTRS
jgi:hypothetical protein